MQHLDAFPKSKRPKGPPGYEDARALSVVVCLEPCEAGGEFEVVRGSAPAMLPTGVVRANACKYPVTIHELTGVVCCYQPVGKPEAIPLGAGDAVVFPSKRLMHQVAAVTRGQRKSLALFARTPSKIVRSAYDSDDEDADDDDA